MTTHLPYRDRTDAGKRLGRELAGRNLPGEILVLGLPRGGVPVAAEVAKTLKAPLDVVIVRKLGVPWQPELAMGALAGGSPPVLDGTIIRALNISKSEVDAAIARETAEIARREKAYRAGHPAPEVQGKTVILVDDGVATGSTMEAGLRSLRGSHPGRLVVAIPVASSEACRLLAEEADDLVCLATPDHFEAVGQWYEDFTQVTDEEVRQLLKQRGGVLCA